MRKLLSILQAGVLAVSLSFGAAAPASLPVALTAFAEEAATEQAAETELAAPETAADTELANAAAYPLTLTDQLGREVTIESEPQTLVSGYYISTSILVALGLEDRLVGIEAKADTRPIYSLAAPGLLELPSVGTAKEFDLEGCAALNPDLIVVPAKLKDSIPAMEELGFTVLAVSPEDEDALRGAIRLLGDATGTSETAAALEAYYDEQLAVLAETLSGCETPSVYMAGTGSVLRAAGSGMYQNTLIERAGGTNAAAELTDDSWVDISYEQLLAWNPEMIFVAAEAEYTVEDVLADENLAALDAVANGAVYQVPAAFEAWDSPVPGCVLGSLWIASVLHPELYTAEAFQAEVTGFYETFYGFTPDLSALS